jgi:hypothetical protein
MLFAQGKPTVKVGDRYEAGVLSVLGLEAVDFVKYDEVDAYVEKRWQWDEAAKSYKLDTIRDRRERLVVTWVLRVKGAVIMACDANLALTFDTLVEWANEQPALLEECYKAALKQNPALAPAAKNPAESSSQSGTHNEEGQPLGEEEAKKKG